MNTFRRNEWHHIIVLCTLLWGGYCRGHEAQKSTLTEVALPDFRHSEFIDNQIADFKYRSDGISNEQAISKSLWPILKFSGKVGRIYYRSIGHPPKIDYLAFPRIDVQSPSNGATALTAVREIFRNIKDFSVVEDETGIRIRIGQIGALPDDILRIKISKQTFSTEGQFNSAIALGEILNSPKVLSAMRNRNIHFTVKFLDSLIIPPDDRYPHLPVSIDDMTVDRVLDMIAKTFGGVVFFGVSQHPNEFQIDFQQMPD